MGWYVNLKKAFISITVYLSQEIMFFECRIKSKRGFFFKIPIHKNIAMKIVYIYIYIDEM